MTADVFSPIEITSMSLFDLSSCGKRSGLSPLKTGPHTKSLPSSVTAAECLPAAIFFTF